MACTSTNAADAASTSAADDADDEDTSIADLAAAAWAGAWEGAAGPFLEDFLNVALAPRLDAPRALAPCACMRLLRCRIAPTDQELNMDQLMRDLFAFDQKDHRIFFTPQTRPSALVKQELNAAHEVEVKRRLAQMWEGCIDVEGDDGQVTELVLEPWSPEW